MWVKNVPRHEGERGIGDVEDSGNSLRGAGEAPMGRLFAGLGVPRHGLIPQVRVGLSVPRDVSARLLAVRASASTEVVARLEKARASCAAALNERLNMWVKNVPRQAPLLVPRDR